MRDTQVTRNDGLDENKRRNGNDCVVDTEREFVVWRKHGLGEMICRAWWNANIRRSRCPLLRCVATYVLARGMHGSVATNMLGADVLQASDLGAALYVVLGRPAVEQTLSIMILYQSLLPPHNGG